MQGSGSSPRKDDHAPHGRFHPSSRHRPGRPGHPWPVVRSCSRCLGASAKRTPSPIALDFGWKLRRRDLDFHETELDYQDTNCRCRIRIDRLDLAMPATRRVRVQREWLHVLEGAPSAEQIGAIIARINRVLRWPAE